MKAVRQFIEKYRKELFVGLIVFLFLLFKTYSLQVSSYSDYELAALKNKTKEVLVQPVRGVIYDRNGNILVNNVPTYDLIIQPSKIKNFDDFIINISKIIELSDSEIENVNKNFKRRATYNRELTIKKDLSKEEIAKLNFNEPKNILISNVTGKEISNSNELKELLVKQIESSVRWRESVLLMIEKGVTEFIEIGPGKVLSGLIKRIDKNVKVSAINSEEDIKLININE